MRTDFVRKHVGWLKVVVSVGLLGWLLLEYAGADLSNALSRAWVPVLLAAFAVNFSASMLIPTLVHKRALGPRDELSLLQLLKVNLAVKFYAMVLPRGVSMGIRWARYRKPLGGRSAAGLVIVELATQVLGAAAIAVIGIAVEWEQLGDGAIPLTGIALLMLAAAGIIIYALLVQTSFRPMARLSNWTQSRVGLSADQVRGGGLRSRQLAPVVTLTLAGQILIVLAAWFVSVDLDLGLSFAAVAWMRSIISLVALVPFTVAGLGIREAGYVAFAAFYGVSGGDALAFALVLLGIQLAIALMGGVLEMSEGVRKDKLDKSPGPEKSGVIPTETGSDSR